MAFRSIREDTPFEKVYKNGKFQGKLIKRRKNAYCSHCEVQINKGEEAIKVEINNGFITKMMGIVHIECFKKLTK